MLSRLMLHGTVRPVCPLKTGFPRTREAGAGLIGLRGPRRGPSISAAQAGAARWRSPTVVSRGFWPGFWPGLRSRCSSVLLLVVIKDRAAIRSWSRFRAGDRIASERVRCGKDRRRASSADVRCGQSGRFAMSRSTSAWQASGAHQQMRCFPASSRRAAATRSGCASSQVR
jgi:hypothetical protein